MKTFKQFLYENRLFRNPGDPPPTPWTPDELNAIPRHSDRKLGMWKSGYIRGMEALWGQARKEPLYTDRIPKEPSGLKLTQARNRRRNNSDSGYGPTDYISPFTSQDDSSNPIRGYFGLGKEGTKYNYDGFAKTYNHSAKIVTVQGDDAIFEQALHVESSFIDNGNNRRGIHVVISAMNLGGDGDQDHHPIHEVFLNDFDETEEHMGVSNKFKISADTAMDLVDEHLATKLIHKSDLNASGPSTKKTIQDFHRENSGS